MRALSGNAEAARSLISCVNFGKEHAGTIHEVLLCDWPLYLGSRMRTHMRNMGSHLGENAAKIADGT